MRVTLSLCPFSLPAVPEGQGGVCQHVLRHMLTVLTLAGVSDIELLFETGLQRKLAVAERRRLVGDAVWARLGPERVRCHDPHDAAQLADVPGVPGLQLNRRALESDLLLSVRVSNEAVSDPLAAPLVGLADAKWLQQQFGPAPADEADAGSWGKAAETVCVALQSRCDVLALQVELDAGSLLGPLSLLQQDEDELSAREYSLLRMLVASVRGLPQSARSALFSALRARYSLTQVVAGEPQRVSEAADRRSSARAISMDEPVDVLVSGVSPLTPHNRGCVHNSLLAATTALRLAARGGAQAWLRPGGTLILCHEFQDRFDHAQHTAYLDFVHQALCPTHDVAPFRTAVQLRAGAARQLRENTALLQMFRQETSYHPAHPAWLWYASLAGRRHVGRVIVVGADNEYIPRRFGFETASSMQEALYRARGETRRPLHIGCLRGVCAAPPLALQLPHRGAA